MKFSLSQIGAPLSRDKLRHSVINSAHLYCWIVSTHLCFDLFPVILHQFASCDIVHTHTTTNSLGQSVAISADMTQQCIIADDKPRPSPSTSHLASCIEWLQFGNWTNGPVLWLSPLCWCHVSVSSPSSMVAFNLVLLLTHFQPFCPLGQWQCILYVPALQHVLVLSRFITGIYDLQCGTFDFAGRCGPCSQHQSRLVTGAGAQCNSLFATICQSVRLSHYCFCWAIAISFRSSAYRN